MAEEQVPMPDLETEAKYVEDGKLDCGDEHSDHGWDNTESGDDHGSVINTEHKSFTPAEIKDYLSTPDFIFNYLNKIFNFDMDVAANKDNAKCAKFLTEEDNALNSEWGNMNWCNPPYSEIPKWIDWAIKQKEEGRSTVFLVPSDTSVGWFEKAFFHASEIKFVVGRISFVNALTGKAVNGNNKGSMFITFDAKKKPSDYTKTTLIKRNDMKPKQLEIDGVMVEDTPKNRLILKTKQKKAAKEAKAKAKE